jgi:hypothetical protein
MNKKDILKDRTQSEKRPKNEDLKVPLFDPWEAEFAKDFASDW